MKRVLKIVRRVLAIFLAIIVLGLLIPEHLQVPVEGASSADWNGDSFWYEPWGASGVHKGIDIFGTTGQAVLAASGGLVIYEGTIEQGGNIVLVLGPKWRVHYYAHLESADASFGEFVRSGDPIGSVGDSGNAAGKQPHLHYVILSLLPYPWLFEPGTQGWKRMFYLDPDQRLDAA